MGRKKLPPEIHRSERIASRVTADDYAYIKAAAEIEGKSVSDYMRDELVTRSKRIVSRANRPK